MTDKIRAALGKLNTANDDDWTSDGLPAMAAVEKAYGEDITRAQLSEAAPSFTRENPAFTQANVEAPATSGEAGNAVRAEQTPTSGAQTGTGKSEALPSSGAPASIGADSDAAAERAEVEAELEAAQGQLNQAQKRFNDAYRSMTAVLEREAQTGTPFSSSVKAFQKSQQAQRAAENDRRRRMDEFLKGAA